MQSHSKNRALLAVLFVMLLTSIGSELFVLKLYFNRILDIRSGDAPRPLQYDRVYWDLVIANGSPPRAAGEPVALKNLLSQLRLPMNNSNGLEFSIVKAGRIFEIDFWRSAKRQRCERVKKEVRFVGDDGVYRVIH